MHRNQFRKQTKNTAKFTSELPTSIIGCCCIEKNNFDALKNSCFYNEDFGKIVQRKLKQYDRELASRVDFDKFCHGPFIQNFCDHAIATEGYSISKYDISSAYITFLASNITLPTSEVIYNYIGIKARQEFSKIHKYSDRFYWLKIEILNCNALTENQLLYVGKYTKTMHCFMSDIEYLEKLKIDYKVLQIICSRGIKSIKFQNFCSNLIDLKSKSPLFKLVCKDLAICGLGEYRVIQKLSVTHN